MNSITLSGVITKEPFFTHEVYGERFFELEVSASRKSGTVDTLIVCASETLLPSECSCGDMIKIVGEVRTKNIHMEDGKSRLHIFVFAREIMEYDDGFNTNFVVMEGFICRDTKYRGTPLGREIAEVMVACNRPYGKSDYIPTVAWGRNARRVGGMSVADKIHVQGRLQRREYTKHYEDGTEEVKVTYELSANMIELIKDEKGELL